ncbi:MAG: tetratricopeptide repeat protein, partial [Bacteroidota bacterium]
MEEFKYNQDQIDTYLTKRGKLTESERQAFEAYMRSNKSFAEEVKLQEDIILGVDYHFNKQLKDKLKAVSGRQKENSKQITLKSFILVAASLSAILFVFFLSNNKTDTESLYNTYYQPYPNIISPTERSANNKEQILAYKLYDQGNYEKAIIAFDELIAETNKNATAKFYQGISYIELENYDLALKSLYEATEGKDRRFIIPAKWYLVLCYLKTEEKE